MDDDVFVYVVNLPASSREMVAPCADGYTVYLAAWASHDEQLSAYRHALRHIANHDWEKTDVNQIEAEAHS